jgi:hypothetical protein
LEALERLSASLTELKDAPTPPSSLPHWREVPETVTTAYKVMEEGVELSKASIATKNTLVGKVNIERRAPN